MSMTFKVSRCPQCGAPPQGSIETLAGCALLYEIEDEEWIYQGETAVWWDEQKTKFDSEGRMNLICGNGHEWYSAYTDSAATPAGLYSPGD